MLKRLFGLAICFILALLPSKVFTRDYWNYKDSETQQCRDIEFVFARGSGQPRFSGDTFQEFERRMGEAAQAVGASYRVTDLDYEAVAVSTGNALGIYVSAGEAYSFGASVNEGISAMARYINSRNDCRQTYWVLSGYSQGAMVVAGALEGRSISRIVYIPLFGDPKLYLPEGEGFMPDACRGKNLSSYRVSVPNCNTDDGLLKQRRPYEVAGYEGLFGLWCNDDDFICGSSKNPLRNKGHSLYDENGSIHEASLIIRERLKAVKPSYASKGDIRLAKTETPKIIVPSVTHLSAYVGESISIPSRANINVFGAEYDWYVGGRKIEANESLDDLSFEYAGFYMVELRLRDGSASALFAVIEVYDYTLEDTRLPPPVTKAIQRNDDSFRLSWLEIPERAKYLGLRVNGYYLGYADVQNMEMIVEDIDFDNVDVDCFWLEGSMEMGYPGEVEIERSVGGISGSVNTNSMQDIAVLSLPFLGMLAFILARKMVLDLKVIKSAPRDKPQERTTRSRHGSRFKRRVSMQAT